MLHEEEFFDAIDATLDKWDKEEEKVSWIVKIVQLKVALLSLLAVIAWPITRPRPP